MPIKSAKSLFHGQWQIGGQSCAIDHLLLRMLSFGVFFFQLPFVFSQCGLCTRAKNKAKIRHLEEGVNAIALTEVIISQFYKKSSV